jgi:hypothetical protein
MDKVATPISYILKYISICANVIEGRVLKLALVEFHVLYRALIHKALKGSYISWRKIKLKKIPKLVFNI